MLIAPKSAEPLGSRRIGIIGALLRILPSETVSDGPEWRKKPSGMVPNGGKRPSRMVPIGGKREECTNFGMDKLWNGQTFLSLAGPALR